MTRVSHWGAPHFFGARGMASPSVLAGPRVAWGGVGLAEGSGALMWTRVVLGQGASVSLSTGA